MSIDDLTAFLDGLIHVRVEAHCLVLFRESDYRQWILPVPLLTILKRAYGFAHQFAGIEITVEMCRCPMVSPTEEITLLPTARQGEEHE